jgi:hypothetical protein
MVAWHSARPALNECRDGHSQRAEGKIMTTPSGKKPAKASGSKAKRAGRLAAGNARRFLAQYREAWESRNADLAASLFTRDAHYWENPFGPPIVGREAIRSYWKAATEKQQDIHFSVHSSLHQKYTLVADWVCAYRSVSDGARRELAGMLFADFYGDQVRTFRECWLRRTV